MPMPGGGGAPPCRELQPGALAPRGGIATPRDARPRRLRAPSSIDLRAPPLRDLTLDGCAQLTRADVAAPNLQRLAMRGCVGCSPAVLDAIARGCPRLRAVDLRGCPSSSTRLSSPTRAARPTAPPSMHAAFTGSHAPLAAAIAPSGGSSYEGGATGWRLRRRRWRRPRALGRLRHLRGLVVRRFSRLDRLDRHRLRRRRRRRRAASNEREGWWRRAAVVVIIGRFRARPRRATRRPSRRRRASAQSSHRPSQPARSASRPSS